jgi:sugar phosphate isomerase/epimerase
MKYGICNETFLDWPFDKAFEFARDCGYTGIEIAPFTMANDVREISAQSRTEVRQQADAASLEVIGLHWLLAKTEGLHLTTSDGAVRQATTQYLEALAHLCHDLGGHVMVFGSPQQRNVEAGMSTSQAMENATEVIRAALPVLEQLDITLAIEPLGPAEGNFLNTAAEGVQLIEMVDSPHCRLHLDTKAMSSEATPIPDIIRANHRLLEHFHANDPNKLGPGFGELEFEPIFQALRDVDYQGWVSVEVFDYAPGIERLAQESITYMQDCVQKIGS